MSCALNVTDETGRKRIDSPASDRARRRLLSHRGETLLVADWMRVLMMHFEVDAHAFQHTVPYELDLHEGRALVTLVAFTMENMRPRVGGKLGSWLLKPIATHDFLNVRTYVRHQGGPGIHFLAEWLSNWLAVQLGPRTFGLPYRHGHTSYQHDGLNGRYRGSVQDVRTKARFEYRAEAEPTLAVSPCPENSLDEWLMERYAAFNSAGGRKRFFRVWHPPWPQVPAAVTMVNLELLEDTWPFFKSARLIGGNFSPGLKGVWMGRPHFA
ncbi:MAG TPA: DUF2071 domain-containing protein [Verrucomicrobiae bacterium]|nr:DUF2071 domain-containing protein [Verrucomicrobiae bacterium]